MIIACRKKQQGKGVGQWNQFHVQWQEKGHPKDAWFGRSELVHLFGGSGDKAIKLFRAEMETPKVAETSVKGESTNRSNAELSQKAIMSESARGISRRTKSSCATWVCSAIYDVVAMSHVKGCNHSSRVSHRS